MQYWQTLGMQEEFNDIFGVQDEQLSRTKENKRQRQDREKERPFLPVMGVGSRSATNT